MAEFGVAVARTAEVEGVGASSDAEQAREVGSHQQFPAAAAPGDVDLLLHVMKAQVLVEIQASVAILVELLEHSFRPQPRAHRFLELQETYPPVTVHVQFREELCDRILLFFARSLVVGSPDLSHTLHLSLSLLNQCLMLVVCVQIYLFLTWIIKLISSFS